jgi:hypothetical protein
MLVVVAFDEYHRYYLEVPNQFVLEVLRPVPERGAGGWLGRPS